MEHGFSDAAEPGYSAALYVKNIRTNTSHLLAGKVRVTTKKEAKNCDNITIPRLELSGAQLLAEFAKKVLDSIDMDFQRICLWSDCRFVLDWIHADPKRYKKFIATKISKINKLFHKSVWSHVRSEDNASDRA